jgi:two-component system, NarL family, sensor histidine kinase BarA
MLDRFRTTAALRLIAFVHACRFALSRRASWPAVLVGLLLVPGPGQAQPGDSTLRAITPAQARLDADGDSVPDLLGRTVAVGGRASLPADPTEDRFNTAIQSGNAGLTLVGDSVTAPVRPGDSLIVHGTLDFRNGQTILRVASYRVVPGPLRPPEPRRLRLNQPLEPFEGMLVSFEATAVAQRRVSVGTTLMIADGDSLFYALAFGNTGALLFGHVHAGERVRVTGILGQHDTAAPYSQGYQIYPATPADVRVTGQGVAFYRLVALVGVLLLGLALAVIALLLARSRRRLARQLQAEQRYRLLFEHTDDAVFLHEIVGEGVAGLRLLARNPAAAQMLGADTARTGPQPRLDDPAAAEAVLRRVRAEGRVTTTLRMHRADGTPLVMHADAFTVKEGRRELLMSLLTDVTQQEAYAQGLEQARERAEAYARLQQQFVANVSHEIRTPLTGIIGFADVLREDLVGEPQQFAGMIEVAGRRLLETLDAILQMARLEAQGQALPLRQINLAAVLRQAVGTLDVVARRRQVALHMTIPEVLMAPSDASALDRIVTNLVGNALKFTPAGGVVAVTLHEEEDAAVLAVRDTGIGISEAFQAELFEPFTQEAPGGDREQGGAGLGLAITHRLVGQLGGTIGVESRKGAGTTFTVRLPLEVPAPVPEPVASPV